MSVSAIAHVDANDRSFRTALKEAVVEGVVRRAHDRITGRGDLGKIVLGDPPTKLFAAGFLLPAVKAANVPGEGPVETEVTSPIHLATMGMSFQVVRNAPGRIVIKPKGAVYVRVLPSTEDMSRAEMTFGLSKEMERAVRSHYKDINRRMQSEAQIAPDDPEARSKRTVISAQARQKAFLAAADEQGLSRPDAERARVTSQAKPDPVAAETAKRAFEQGIPDPDDLALVIGTEGADGEADEAAEEVEAEGRGTTFVWTVRPGADRDSLPEDRFVRDAEIPQKWLRLLVDWPELAVEPSWSENEVNQACAEHSAEMASALASRLATWVAADDTAEEIGGRLWAMPRATIQDQAHRVLPSQVANWDEHLGRLRTRGLQPALPDLKLEVDVRISPDPLDPNRLTVRVILANRSSLPSPRLPDRLLDRTLYLSGIEVTMPNGLHADHSLKRVRPSYRWNDWLTHAGIGINCGLSCTRPREDGAPLLLTTDTLPTWRQPRIEAFQIDPAPSFARLASADGGIEVVRALANAYRDWIADTVASEPWRVPGGTSGEEASEENKFREDVDAWGVELRRIEIGLKVLEESLQAQQAGASEDDERVAPLRAWRATNAAFERVHRRAGKRGEFAPETWRLFQLAFLVSHLPGVVSRIPFWSTRADLFVDDMATDDATASLLYFPTGGGKSEAFFGLLVLQAFVDRIRGKRRGVSALVRYPLRLLTTQQANRFARIFAMAEMERLERRIAGDPFQIGFWVGGGNTPNSRHAESFTDVPQWSEGNLDASKESALLRDSPEYGTVAKWRRLTECPFCGSGTVGLRRRREGDDQRLAHVCFDRTCEWNAAHGGIEPLPFHVMDTDIYAYAPTVLLGTVDKMAAIGFSPHTIARVFSMFGFAPWVVARSPDGKRAPGAGRLTHPRRPSQNALRAQAPNTDWADPSKNGCTPIGPVYKNARVELFDPFPSIEVQDEAHLLEQSLGTFSGLFGSLLEAAFTDLAPILESALVSRLPSGAPRRAKVIAASATVQGPERQIQMLYQRRVRMFPHPGPDLYESFFARLASPDPRDGGRNEITDPEHRVPTRRVYVAVPTNGRPHTSATVAVLSSLHLTLTELYRLLVDAGQVDEAKRILASVLPEGPLSGVHRDALAAASDAELAEALDLARIALCYVTTKKGGDSVQAALGEFVPRDHARAGVGLGEGEGLETGLITGSVEIDKIQEIVEKARPKWKPGDLVDLERDFLRELRGIVATSAISHGVDIERLNLMVFAGLPSDIAEYVQASSRVGRTHVGASILVPTPQRVRDMHVVGIHDVFHRFLERMVQPAAVDRWGENAIARVVASAIQVKLCAVDHFKGLASADEAHRSGLWDSSGVTRVRRSLLGNRIDREREIRTFLARAIGIEDLSNPLRDEVRANLRPAEADWYVGELSKLVKAIADDLQKDTFEASRLRSFWTDTVRPEPMTSLRDVDEPGRIVASGRSFVRNGRRPHDAKRLMKVLRHGDAAWGEGEGDGTSREED